MSLQMIKTSPLNSEPILRVDLFLKYSLQIDLDSKEAALENGCSAAEWPADGGKELPERLFSTRNTQEIIRL